MERDLKLTKQLYTGNLVQIIYNMQKKKYVHTFLESVLANQALRGHCDHQYLSLKCVHTSSLHSHKLLAVAKNEELWD